MDISILLLGASLHFKEPELNPINPGLGIVARHSYLYAAAGGYYNSYERESLFASLGASFDLRHERGAPWGEDNPWAPRLELGLMYVTGYEVKTLPAVGAAWEVSPTWAIRLQAMDAAVGLGLEYDL